MSGPGGAAIAEPDSATTTVAFDAIGDYELKLEASDSELSGEDEVRVTVLPPNEAPNVNAGADQALTLPIATTTLEGAVTDDALPRGSLLVFLWSQVAGPGTASFSSASSLRTDVTFDLPGAYTLRLSASDGARSAFDEVRVTVALANTAPLVNAGADSATSLPSATLPLNGQATDDGLPAGTLNFEWTLLSGPGTVVFGTPAALATTATFDVAGSYLLRLTVSDTVLTASDEVVVLVASDSFLPDLRVEEVDTSALVVNPQTLAISGSVAARIGNPGTGPAAGPFDVTFFEDRNGSGAFEAASDNLIAVGQHFGVQSGGAGPVVAPVAPTSVEFSGNLIYAFADSGFAVSESNEANNVGSSAAACDTTPRPTDWNVQVEWSWNGSAALPDFSKILMTPVVIDLNDDEVPDVVFIAHRSTAFSDGILTAVSGQDGSLLFQVTNPSHMLYTPSQLAAGDIDLDGRPEIVAVHELANTVLAFEHDGTFKWQSGRLDSSSVSWGGPSLGDIDADGTPEVIVGRTVLNNDGTTRWVGTGGSGDAFKGPLSFLADLDLDGIPELVAGDTAYRSNGTIYWQNALADGLNAIGNFDTDPFPEIAWVSFAKIALLEHDGALKWGPIPFPTLPRFGGPPIVADFDGDGFDEIGVPDRTRYYVFEEDGSLRWQAFIDDNSDGNGSSAFDFDGDGLPEIVHNDVEDLRIRRGTDGSTLFETAVGNITAYESAMVADVDGDGEAELVAVSDGTGVTEPGLYVFGEANGLWVSARKLYNQHAYHVTNIRDDGTIPAVEARSWAHGFGFRQNAFASIGAGAPVSGCAFAKPDLTGSELRILTSGVGRELTVRVGNGGARVAGIGVPVSFYDSDPRLGGRRLGTVPTRGLLHPGRFEDVTLTVPLSATTQFSIWVSTDDFGNLAGGTSESDKENNLFDSGLALLGAAGGQPDLIAVEVDTEGVVGDWQTLAITGKVKAQVRNQGESDAGAFDITFFEDVNRNEVLDGADTILGTAGSPGLAARTLATLEAPVTGSLRFRDAPVSVYVDSAGVVTEANEENNVARSGGGCTFVPGASSFALATEWSFTGATTLPTFTNVAATPAVVDLNSDGFADVVFAAFSGGSRLNAHLRAVSGRDGTLLFTASALAHQIRGESGIAVGDIDGDGRPEIVAIDDGGFQLRAFEHDGTVKWETANLEAFGQGAPSLLDLEGDGTVEILMGRYVLNGNGTTRWVGTEPSKGQSSVLGPMSLGVDLDLDGVAEVLVGNVSYRASGALYWKNGSLSDGTNAIGNFDSDEFPEIVHVQGTSVYLLEHTGAVIWGPLNVDLGNAGPPAVGDFDGDGRAEVALASRDKLYLIEPTGYARWTSPVTHSASNGGAGVSAFDFDGDRALELVYMDETSLRLYRGSDGGVVAEAPGFESCDYSGAYPVVADVDSDGRAEIVAGMNSACTGSVAHGMVALGGRFTTARAEWTEHGYQATNDTFRAQGHGEKGAFASAELTASFVRRAEDGNDLAFTVRVGNAGAGPAGVGIPVSVYNGNPRLGFPLLATISTTRSLLPGEFEDVLYRVGSQVSAEDSLHFAVDDAGGVSRVGECEEENNVHDSGFFLNLAPVVEATGDSYAVFPDARASVRATVSDDGLPLQGSLTLAWGGFGPNSIPVLFDDRHAATTVARFLAGGSNFIGVQVSDGALVASDSFLVQVDPTNVPPRVDAGADIVVELPSTTASLTGLVSDDGFPSNKMLTTTWFELSGPGPVEFQNARALSTLATLSEAGEYVLELLADDGGASVSDKVTVKVVPPNQGPVVSAGPDETIFSPSTILKGVLTDDGLPVGSVLSTSWSLASGPGIAVFANPLLPATSVQFSASGSYVLRLTASDGSSSASDEVRITVEVTNVAPRVSAGIDQTIAFPVTSATLSGLVTDDGLPFGSTVQVVWNLVLGPAPVVFADPFSRETAVSFTAAGSYLFSLQASDGDLVSTDEMTVLVDDGNTAPVVNAGADQSITLPTNQAPLSATATDDGLPSGATLSLLWTQVSGPAVVSFSNPNAASTMATFPSAGSYVLRLTASDSLLSGSDTLAVRVEPAPPSGPAPSVAIVSPLERARVTDFTDVVGTVASDALLSWTLESGGTRVASGTTPVANGVLGTFDPTLLMNGLHEIRLSATDTAGRTVSDSVFVVVKEDLKVGHFTVSFVDLEVPVSGLPIRITRTYDSRDKRKGDFGFGWRMDLSSLEVEESAVLGFSWLGQRVLGGLGSYCVTPASSSVVTVTLPDGEVFEFEPVFSPQCQLVPILDGTMSFRALAGTNATLEPVDGNFVFVAGSFPAPVNLYDGSFRLYDPKVYRLTLPDGRAFVVNQETGLQSIRDLNGNQLTVTRTGITHSSGKAVAFDRDSEGRIRSLVDPDGHPTFYEYDAAGDLISYRDRENNETTFTYLEAVPHHLKDIEDPRGITPIRNEYDPVTGRLLKHTDAFGNTITYNHLIGTRQEEVRDRKGELRVLAYDSRGNVIHETDPKGKVILRSFDSNNNRTCETEAHDPSQSGASCESSPKRALFLYDAKDNLLSQTDAEGNATSFTYNARNQVLTTTDARQKTTRNFYDSATGNLTKTTDALGNETLLEYDGSGNVRKQTQSVGGVLHVTEFQYDASGNLKKEIDAEGNETAFSYDANGNPLTETRRRTLSDGSTQTLTTTFIYDKLGRLVRTTDPDGSFTRTVYDSLGKQKESYDKLGRKTSFEYDAMGQLSKIAYPDATFEEFTYDKEGRRLTSKDRGGRTTRFEYDGLGRLTKTTFPDTTFTENVYDDAGRLERTIDARGKVTRFEYDAAGRRKKVIDPLLNATEFFYDGNGNQTGIKDPRGKTTSFEYDELNRRKRTVFPDTTFTETVYDELGRRIQEIDQAGIATGFEYDKLGRLTKVIQDVNGLALETHYDYDDVGNRISQTDANGHTTSFEYDELGRETKRILPDGKFETKTYDAAGNLRVWKKFDGNEIRYDYDLNNRLTTKNFPDMTSVGFTYTATGRRDTVTDSRGVTAYGYDVRDRLTALVYPDGHRMDYGYDANGNRTSLTATIGSTVLTTAYTYDDASRLDVVTDPNGLTSDHNYDPNGNRASLSYPNGTSTSYVYDDLNRLTNLSTTGPSGVIQSYDFTLGPAGNRTRIDEADGTTRAYGYDNLYRLTLETVTNTLGLVYQKSFVYDDVGNRLNQTTTGQGAAVVGYGYDTRDRLLTENLTNYGWDDNGNLRTKSGEATYFWDLEDRLVRVEKADGTIVEHTYDTDGVRVRTESTIPGQGTTVTNFLVDTSGSLSHVVAETEGSGAFLALYVRGDDLLSIIRPVEQRFYHADGLGSIRFLTDENANVTDAYEYTAFGEELSHVGMDAQPYQFAGEPFDPNVGFYYNRARWLDPSEGRFTSIDPWVGDEYEPSTLHKYLYVHADPINRDDPTGLGEFSLGSLLTAISVRVTVFAISHPTLTAAIGFVGAALIPEEIQNTMMASGLPGVSPIGAVGRAEARGILLIKNWASRRFAASALGRTSNLAGEAFESFARRHLFPGASGPIPVGPGKQSIDLLWRKFLVELKTSRSLEPDDVKQLLLGAEHAKNSGLDLAYVFLRQPTKGTADQIFRAGGKVFYIFPF